MISYVRQVAVCESVRETIRRALAYSDELSVRQQANYIPSYDSILRAVSLSPGIDTEEKLKNFIIEHLANSLRLSTAQREYLSAADAFDPPVSGA